MKRMFHPFWLIPIINKKKDEGEEKEKRQYDRSKLHRSMNISRSSETV